MKDSEATSETASAAAPEAAGASALSPPLACLVFDSVVGPLRLRAEPGLLIEIKLNAPDPLSEPPSTLEGSAICHQARQEIEAFLDGKRQDFTVPYEARGSAFHRRIWKFLEAIPYGEVVTYGDLARQAGGIGASQAVGLACGTNPIPLIIPCHRVLAKNGLGGFGGGLPMKKQLLRLEAETSGQSFPEQGLLPF